MERDSKTALTNFRSKYPGAYDKYSDSELLGALKRKYPGAYEDLAIKDSIPQSENVLQRAMKAAGASAQTAMQNAGNPLGVSVDPKFPFIPSIPTDNPAISSGMEEVQMPFTKGNPWAQAASGIASGVLAGGALGGKQAVKGTAKGIGGFIKNVRNPSKVFGEKIGALEKANPSTKVDYSGILSKYMDDPMAKKVIDKSGVLEKYGGSNMGEGGTVIEKMKNLTLQESQNLINDIKVGLRQSLKEGTLTKSNEIGIQKMLSELSGNQNALFKGMDKARRGYGIGKNFRKTGDALKKYGLKAAITGAVGTAAGTATYGALAPFVKNK